jgi:hypothetical protein
MKVKLNRALLEISLNKCFDACERKSSESLTNFNFNNDTLTLCTKGSFTFFTTIIENIDIDQENIANFTLKTSAILEFVKYISSEEIVIVYDDSKKSCLLSTSDKKSKIAFQVSNEIFEDPESKDDHKEFKITNLDDFINKLNYASRFCSNSIDDYPLTGIYCKLGKNTFDIKSTNGPSFYQCVIECGNDNDFEFYLQKKSSTIIKNISSNEMIKTFGVNTKYFYIESERSKLKIYIDKCEKNSFPAQIDDCLTKESACTLKISSFEFLKTLKYFNGVIPNSTVKLVCNNGLVTLESSQSNFAAKENLAVESQKGSVSACYSTKMLIDCLEALPFSWVDVDFILMQDNFYICKISNIKNITLLCPDLS